MAIWNDEEKTIVILMSFLSLVMSVWITFIYLKFKELQRHPSGLFFWISVFDIGISQHTISLFLSPRIASAGNYLKELFYVLSFHQMTSKESDDISCAINQMMLCGFLSGMMCYNICVCVDLIITIRNPLIEGRSRMKYYHLCSIIVTSGEVIYNIAKNLSSRECQSSNDSFIDELMNFGVLTVLFFIYLVVGIVSFFYALIKLSNEMIPQHNAAKIYFRRHILYITIFWLLWGVAAIAYWSNDMLNSYGSYLCIFLIVSAGFILAVIRNSESAFLKKSIYFLRRRKVKDTMKEPPDMWNTPISNIIYSDLKAQTTFCILSGLYEAMKNSRSSSFIASQATFTERDYAARINHEVKLNPYNSQGLNIFKLQAPYFVVTEYAPSVFAHLRSFDKIEKYLILESLNPDNNLSALIKIHEKKGGSGSLFMFTDDQKFFMKTIAKKERQFFIRDLLKGYHHHIKKEEKSILCRTYGLFTIRVPGLSPIELMLGQNLMVPGILKYYDLKGSSINRQTNSPEENFIGPFKDGDFIADQNELVLHPMVRDSLMEGIHADVQFLLRHGIMDYSLLVFIIDKPRNFTDLIPDAYNQEWYKLSIIDYLGKYDYARKMEHYYKAVKIGQNVYLCSVVDPKRYANRFLNFLHTRVLRTFASIIGSCDERF
ncbi:unnamed protein product [Blepharisma stoltei]|uniref:PIPK domain-containing protein n=1 Tax=Blepharisma stoltei TaxID=1481888 RepID=A0AAU9J4U8_9CILI|nr:unnamed protein product [Blepharisma stoltei]